MAEYSLLCPFLDDSNSYTCGFEFGQFWETMKRLKSGRVMRNLFHVENQEQITLAANRMRWRVLKMEPVKETPGWVYIEVQK